jgi:hypothetical protein
MSKLVFCCRRKSNLTVEEFQRYWLQEHGPLVRSLREAIPQMTRYVQSHTTFGPATDAVQASRGTDEPYDGITEVWLDDDARPGATPASIDAGLKLLQDELTFIDMGRSSVFLTVEHVIF